MADDGNANRADELFRQGKQRLAQRDFAGACPMFAESFGLDPALGTLLALAMCHEGEGKLGSAFREYKEVVAHPDAKTRPDREQAARANAASLASKVSRLTVLVSSASEAQGFEVRVDRALIEPAHFGVTLAIDGGEHIVEASARDRESWRTHVTVAQSLDSQTVSIPVLEPALRAERNQTDDVAPSVPPRALRIADASPGFTTVQWAGLGTLGAGLVGLGLATFFTAQSVQKNTDSESGCLGDVCTLDARDARLDARFAGDVATVAFITGGSLTVIGVLSYVLGGRARTERAAASGAFTARPWASAHALGTSLHGKF